ncbi:hypothetical protein DXG01_006371, partial [Tephrocybe rancida]
HHVELVVVDNKLNKLIDLVCSRQGCTNGSLEHNRIFATFATIVGLVGQDLRPAATAAVHIQFYGPLPNQTEEYYSFIESPVKSPAPPSYVSQTKLNPFLDLKADEDLWEDADFLDDTEGDDEFDDFIDDREVASGGRPPMFLLPGEEDKNLNNDDDEIFSDEDQYSDNEYPLTAAAVSHKALALHNDMEQWRSLLEHAYEWAREHQPAYQRPERKYFDDRLKPLLPALMYRVRVKDGYEETAAMVLANKLLTAGTHSAPLVKSIIGCVSCPGWVFIESNSANANNLCANVSDIYPRHIYPIVEDLQQYLHEPFVAPKEGAWVRLNSPLLYHGDLAYVHMYNDTSPNHMTTMLKNPGGEGADVLVVPRVEQFLNQTKGKGRAGRPPQQLLERKQAIWLFGANAVVAHDKLNFTYRGQKYSDGLHYLVTHDFKPKVLTHEELALFQHCSFVDLIDIARAINEIAALSLQVTDCIIVTSGELISMTGIVKEFSGNDKEATIRIDSEIAMDVVISPMLLRKVVQVGDRVHVVGGAGDGRVGWVVAVDGTELHVWEDKTALPFKVNVNHVALHHNAQVLSQVVPKQDVNWQPFEESQHPPLHRNLVYLGHRVMVVRRGVFKGYKGIIREILEDDEVRVELSATLKRKVFHLSQLSNLNDEKHKPLIYKYSAKIFQANMPLPTQPVEIPVSGAPHSFDTTSCRVKFGHRPCMESFIKDTRLPSAVS